MGFQRCSQFSGYLDEKKFQGKAWKGSIPSKSKWTTQGLKHDKLKHTIFNILELFTIVRYFKVENMEESVYLTHKLWEIIKEPLYQQGILRFLFFWVFVSFIMPRWFDRKKYPTGGWNSNAKFKN